MIAIGPVATEDDSVLTEKIPQIVNAIAIEGRILDQFAIADNGNLRELYEDVGVLRQSVQILVILIEFSTLRRKSRIRQVINYYSQIAGGIRSLQ